MQSNGTAEQSREIDILQLSSLVRTASGDLVNQNDGKAFGFQALQRGVWTDERFPCTVPFSGLGSLPMRTAC